MSLFENFVSSKKVRVEIDEVRSSDLFPRGRAAAGARRVRASRPSGADWRTEPRAAARLARCARTTKYSA